MVRIERIIRRWNNDRRYLTPKEFCRLFFMRITVWLFAAAVLSTVVLYLWNREKIPDIPQNSNESDGFRQMQLTDDILLRWKRLSEQTDQSRWRILAVLMAVSGFQADDSEGKGSLPDTIEEYDLLEAHYEELQSGELSDLEKSYETILSDLVYFPVMRSSRRAESGVSYADSWLAGRNYQNTAHVHEGTDIMASNNERGYYPIVSMTDGVVENMGWLEKGGYRVGIRSPHGAYLYYAHLYRYADGLEKGDDVKAGQLIGFMGDSGYSKVEGTVGNFDVHLHLGIYLKTEHYEEVSVNPYRILKQVENTVMTGDY